MTRRLARLADIAYRRRGRMVLAWIVATVVIIGARLRARRRVQRRLQHARARSRRRRATSPSASSAATRARRSTSSGRTPAGATSPAARKQRIDAFLGRGREGQAHRARTTPIRVSRDGTIGATTLPLTVPGWDVEKEQGEQLIAAAERQQRRRPRDQARRRPDLRRRRTQSSPEGLGFLGAAIVLLIAFGSVVAAGLPLAIALVGLGHLLRRADRCCSPTSIDVPDWTTAVSGLIGIGVGIDYSLLVLTRFRSALDDGKDRHDAVVEAVTTAGRSVLIAGCTVVIAVLGLCLTGLELHVRRRDLGVARGAGRDARRRSRCCRRCSPTSGPRVDRLRLPFLGPRRSTRPTAEPRVAGGALEPRASSGGPGRRRSSPPRSCSRSPRRRSACGSASPTPATTRPTR